MNTFNFRIAKTTETVETVETSDDALLVADMSIFDEQDAVGITLGEAMARMGYDIQR